MNGLEFVEVRVNTPQTLQEPGFKQELFSSIQKNSLPFAPSRWQRENFSYFPFYYGNIAERKRTVNSRLLWPNFAFENSVFLEDDKVKMV